MTDPCFEYFKIDTFDIWEFEREQYLRDNSNDEHISKLKERYEEVILYTNAWQKKEKIVITVSPFTDIKRFDSGEHKGYFDRNIRDLRNAKSLKDHLILNYFLVRDEMYSFLQTIFINPNHKNFDYWFSLKLSQYSQGLKYVNQFLDSVLQELFNDDSSRFTEFLEIALVQFEKVLNPDLIRLVNKWSERKNTLIIPSNSKLETRHWKHMTSTESTSISADLGLAINDETDEIPLENFNPLLGNVIERDIDWGDEQKEPKETQQKSDNTEELYIKHYSFFFFFIKAYKESNLMKAISVFESTFKALVDNGFLSKDHN